MRTRELIAGIALLVVSVTWAYEALRYVSTVIG